MNKKWINIKRQKFIFLQQQLRINVCILNQYTLLNLLYLVYVNKSDK